MAVQKCKNIWKTTLGRFFKNIWKSAIFNNWKKIFLKLLIFKDFLKNGSKIWKFRLWISSQHKMWRNSIHKFWVDFLFFFWNFQLARKFSMYTDFVINFYFKNDWVIAVWKFRLWISMQQFIIWSWKLGKSKMFKRL